MIECSKSSQLVAWCTGYRNKITILDLETKKEYEFEGAQLGDRDGTELFQLFHFNTLLALEGVWSHVKEISDTELLVSVKCADESANMVVYKIAANGKVREVYSFEEVTGSKYLNLCESLKESDLLFTFIHSNL